MCIVVSDQSMHGKSNVDAILLDLLKYFVSTGTTEKRQHIANEMMHQFDSAMTRHWLRTGVNPLTFLITRKNKLTVLMGGADIGAVVTCDGQWQQVAPQVTRPLATSSFANTMCSFIDEMLSKQPISNPCSMSFSSCRGHDSKVPEPSGRQSLQIQEGPHANEARDRIQIHGAEAHRLALDMLQHGTVTMI